MKLRVDKCDLELGILFGVSNQTAGKIFNTFIRFLFYQLQEVTQWLPKDIVQEYMPSDFKSKFPETRVLLDATENFIEKPSNVKDQSATWSSYKNHNTLKTMIGISPRGAVTFVSPAYGGRTSDR